MDTSRAHAGVRLVLFPEDLEDLAARLDPALKISLADRMRTKRGPGVVGLPAERPKTALQQKTWTVGPVGIEPTTFGLKVRCSAY